MNDDIQALIEFIRNETGYAGPIDEDVDLLEAGVLDWSSTFAVEDASASPRGSARLPGPAAIRPTCKAF